MSSSARRTSAASNSMAARVYASKWRLDPRLIPNHDANFEMVCWRAENFDCWWSTPKNEHCCAAEPLSGGCMDETFSTDLQSNLFAKQHSWVLLMPSFTTPSERLKQFAVYELVRQRTLCLPGDSLEHRCAPKLHETIVAASSIV